MAQKDNATCLICGKGYYVCLSCRDAIKTAPWKSYTDTSEHYKVFQIVKGFHNGVYSKEEAKSKLNNVDLSDLSDYRQKIKDVIDEILKEDKQIIVKEDKEVVVEEELVQPVNDDVETVEEAEDFSVEEIAVVENIETPVVSRKRNYKVEE